MSITEKSKYIVEEFEKFPSWEEKYSHLIKIGKDCRIDPKYQTDQYKVKGCQSSVWMFAEMKDGKIYYQGDSDAAIVKGLVALALRVYSGETAQEIMQSNAEFMEKLGLNTHLSQTRANGLASMIKQIKLFAFALSQISGRS
ncbi:MAG: SufE family protein [Bdellovibrionota bacterium]